MAIKKAVLSKAKKTKTGEKAAVKKTVAAPSNFPKKTFVFIAVVVFIFAGLFLIWLSFINSDDYNTADPNAWIYSRHKFDQYRANNCGGDPLVTMPECPR